MLACKMQSVELCLQSQAMFSAESLKRKLGFYLIQHKGSVCNACQWHHSHLWYSVRRHAHCSISIPLFSTTLLHTAQQARAEEEEVVIGATARHWDPPPHSRQHTQPCFLQLEPWAIFKSSGPSQRAAFGFRWSRFFWSGKSTTHGLSQSGGSGERCDAVKCPFKVQEVWKP